MKEHILRIKKRMETGAEVFEEAKNKLQTNPIKNRFNHFMSSKMKVSVLDLLRSK